MNHQDMPPATDMVKPLPLIRPQAEKPLNTILMAEGWVGVFTHWWGGKTVLHDETECRACDRNIAKLWKGFIPVCDAFQRDRIALLQFTGRCCVTLLDHKRESGGLLGARVLWTRVGKQKNSPLRCEVMGWADVKDPFTYTRTSEIVAAIFRDTGHWQMKA
jgi:hypothetical protein